MPDITALVSSTKAILQILADARNDEDADAMSEAGGYLFGDVMSEAMESAQTAIAAIDEATTTTLQSDQFKAYDDAIRAIKRCASGEIERPLTERTPWPEARAKLEKAIQFVSD